MKNIFKKNVFIYSLLLLGFFSSCEDFLEKQEDEALTFDKVWKNRETVKQYWYTTMAFLPNDAKHNATNTPPWIGASDEGSVTYNWFTHRGINFGSWNPTKIPYEKMKHYYKGIRECNIFLANVDRTSDPLVKPQDIETWKLQTRFARAYYYFMMMRIYGPVFILEDELIDITASSEALERQRNTWDECVNYVVGEMEYIAERLPEAPSSDDMYGLATKGAAKAVISRLKLYSARALFNGNNLYAGVINPDGTRLFPKYDGQKWIDAAKAAKDVIDLNIYSLYRAGNNNPYEDWLGITTENWNSEIIWSTGYHTRYDIGIHTTPTGIAGTAYGGISPTLQQVDAYAMNNGKYPIKGYNNDGSPVVDPNSGYPDNEFTKETFTNPSFKPGYDTAPDESDKKWPLMFKDREPRFYLTVFWSDSYWRHGNSHTLISFAKGGNGNKSHDYPKPGFMMHRFYDHTLRSDDGKWGNFVFPTFRLGEIYLNFIEAVLECKIKGLSLPSGYYNQAMEYWDDLRDRAGLTPITEVYPGASAQELLELVRRERRVELAFENHRYFDTRTWMIAKKTDGGPMYGMNISTRTDDTKVTPSDFWQRTVFETRVFRDKHYLYPFSQEELDRNKKLVQNYGW